MQIYACWLNLEPNGLILVKIFRFLGRLPLKSAKMTQKYFLAHPNDHFWDIHKAIHCKFEIIGSAEIPMLIWTIVVNKPKRPNLQFDKIIGKMRYGADFMIDNCKRN